MKDHSKDNFEDMIKSEIISILETYLIVEI